MRISVIGTGYLGATHAAAMAELGFEVTGVDVDAWRAIPADPRSVVFA
jgi:UDP-glucose 6-dehydrogenase